MSDSFNLSLYILVYGEIRGERGEAGTYGTRYSALGPETVALDSADGGAISKRMLLHWQ